MGAPALFLHPFGAVKEQRSDQPLPVPEELFGKNCQNCHSEKTFWPWYSYVPPASWLVERDVSVARQHLNFSRWSEYPEERKRELLAQIAAEVRSKQMPPARYQALHPEARISDAEIRRIYDWAKKERQRRE
jgi:mono/diheme cytochrome c family protein